MLNGFIKAHFVDYEIIKMRKDLQDKLYADFPELFCKLDSFWIPDGWHDLIYNLSAEINNIRNSLFIVDNYVEYHVIQIKSKFGGLRYYMSNSTKEMNDLISIAEGKSYDLCGACGNHRGPRKPNESVWKEYNLCETCRIVKDIIE